MKKLIFIISSLLVLTACGGIDDAFKDEPEFTSLTGVLTAQPAGDDYTGTHLLTDKAGLVTPLRSLTINLGGLQYLENEVELMGVMNPDDGVFEVSSIKVLEILSDTKVTLGKFVTYKNPEYGFELKYYDDWEVFEETDKVIFAAPTEDKDAMEILQFPFSYQPTTNEDGSTDTPLSAYFDQEGWTDVIVYTEHKVGPDRLEARNFGNGIISRYYLYRSGLIYEISIPYKSDQKDIFDEMLAEFRFIGFDVEDDVGAEVIDSIDSIGTPSTGELPEVDMEFNTFESLPYSFSGKYPSNWYYAGSAGSDNVLRHYGFSDEPIDNDNITEILSLDVVSKPVDAVPTTVINGQDFIEMYSANNTLSVYTSVDGQYYKISGSIEYKDLILYMAANISPIKREEE